MTEEIRSFRASWAALSNAHPIETIAAVVLAEHTHFIWRLSEGDDDVTMRVGLLKSGFTRRPRASEKTEGRKGDCNIWQCRFWEPLILDTEDLDAPVAYIHWNPVHLGET